jgi:hypothetical protein
MVSTTPVANLQILRKFVRKKIEMALMAHLGAWREKT